MAVGLKRIDKMKIWKLEFKLIVWLQIGAFFIHLTA